MEIEQALKKHGHRIGVEVSEQVAQELAHARRRGRRAIRIAAEQQRPCTATEVLQTHRIKWARRLDV